MDQRYRRSWRKDLVKLKKRDSESDSGNNQNTNSKNLPNLQNVLIEVFRFTRRPALSTVGRQVWQSLQTEPLPLQWLHFLTL